MAKYILVHGIRVCNEFIPETFGRLTSIGPKFRIGKNTFQVFECSCGNVKVLRDTNTGNKSTLSCGCFRNFRVRETCKTHGMSGTCTYYSWCGMNRRCHNSDETEYPNYGGRGITVCDRWREPNGQGFLNFIADMGGCPEGLTIERNDVNGNYCPENCRWATKQEQANNRRNTLYIEYRGVRDTIRGWAKRTGLPLELIRGRVQAGCQTNELFKNKRESQKK